MDTRLNTLEERLNRAERRSRRLCGLALAVVMGGLLIVSRTHAIADPDEGGAPFRRLQVQIDALTARVSTLEKCVSRLQTSSDQSKSSINELKTALANEIGARQAGDAGLQTALASETMARQAADSALQARASAQETKTQFITIDGTNMIVTGANLHVRSGSGATDGAINGLGNLIVGYNELLNDGSDVRSGSHNLIVGKNNNYSGFGGLVAGWQNAIGGQYAAVSGGAQNGAMADFSSISGGTGNWSNGVGASISGGNGNYAAGLNAAIGGGNSNEADGDYSVISGGFSNTAGGEFSVVSGGGTRSATSRYQWAAGSLSEAH